MPSKTNQYKKAFFLIAIISGCIFFYAQAKNSISNKIGIVYQGEKYSIAGEGTQGFCHLINNQSCKKHPEQKYTDFEQTLCEINQNCTTSKKALHAVLSGSADLASVESKDVTLDMDVKALMHLTTDQKMLLVSRKDFPYKDGLHVVKTVHGFITSIRSNPNSFKKGKALKIVPFYGGYDALERYIKFDKGYTLHSGLVAYYLPHLETPLTITYGIDHCAPDTGVCTSISDIPNKNYREANRIATMGKGLIPYLKEAIKSDNDFLVMKAAHTMGRIWPREPDLLTAPLLKLLDHPNDEVKEQAIYALSAQKPLHSETIDRLIQLAESNPIERESFSDGSHGMSQEVTVLKQMPVSQHASYAILNAPYEVFFPVLKGLVQSKNSDKQLVGIAALNQYLSRTKHTLRKSLPKGKPNNITLSDFPAQAIEVVEFLSDEQDKLQDNSKKALMKVLVQYIPEKVNRDTILSAANALKSDHKVCHMQRDQEFCEIPDMKAALYKLRPLGSDAAIPEVFQGLEFVLKNGFRTEKQVAYSLLSRLAPVSDLPDSLVNTMLQIDAAGRDNAIVQIAIRTERWQTPVIKILKLKLESDHGWKRVSALHALGTLGKNAKTKRNEISQLAVKAIKNEKYGIIIQYMMKGLGELASVHSQAMEALLEYASFEQAIIDQYYTELGHFDPSDKLRVPSDNPNNFPPPKLSHTDIFNIRAAVFEALGNMESLPNKALDIIKNSYISEMGRENCKRLSSRVRMLSYTLSAYKKHNTSISPLMPIVLELLSRPDNECKARALEALQSMGDSADEALPEITKLIKKQDKTLNQKILHTLRSIGTPTASDILSKHPELTSKEDARKQEVYDLLYTFNLNYKTWE